MTKVSYEKNIQNRLVNKIKGYYCLKILSSKLSKLRCYKSTCCSSLHGPRAVTRKKKTSK